MKRRKFLLTSSASVVSVPTLLRSQNLNSKIQLAAVGTEGRGWRDLEKMSSHLKTETVAFCDVDLSKTARAIKLKKKTHIV